MCNPYDSNPFATDDTEIKNESDANKALARERDRKRNDGLNATLTDMFAPMKMDKHGFWK